MPRRADHFETIEFAAPIGVRVRFVTLIVLAVLAAVAVFNVAWAWGRPSAARGLWPMVLAPLAGLILTGAVALFSRVCGYRLVERDLQVVRLGRINRYPLEGLTAVESDRAALQGAWKKLGNDGLGAITGRFSSRKLGPFVALVTDPAQAVILRWPDRCLVVSPDRTGYFVEACRERAGLRS